MDTCTGNHGLAEANSSSSAPTTTPPHCYIHILPDEIISEILAVVVLSDLQEPTEALYKPKQIPAVSYDFAVLAQLVCKRWQEVAWHTPALWAVLDFKRMRSANLPLFLQRSGIYPLCIDLSEIHGLNMEKELQFRQNIGLALRTDANRISQLYITGGFCSVFLGAFKDLLTNVVNLCKLCLDTGSLGDWTSIPICASLQSLSIIEKFPIFVPPHTLLAALRGCPHLRTLHLETQDFGEWGDEISQAEKPQPFILHQLEQLTLRKFYKWEMTVVFSLIATPTLKEFIVAEAAKRPGSQNELGISCPALETLVIEGADISRDIAKEISHVKHLALIKSPHSALEIDIGFQSLRSYWQSLPDPIPLETLKTNHLRLSSLISLLEDDRAVIPKLRQVTVHYADAFCSRNSTDFEKRVGEWSRLSSLVETGVYGIPDEEIEARTRVTSWEEEREWFTELNKTYVMAGWRKD